MKNVQLGETQIYNFNANKDMFIGSFVSVFLSQCGVWLNKYIFDLSDIFVIDNRIKRKKVNMACTLISDRRKNLLLTAVSSKRLTLNYIKFDYEHVELTDSVRSSSTIFSRQSDFSFSLVGVLIFLNFMKNTAYRY